MLRRSDSAKWILARAYSSFICRSIHSAESSELLRNCQVSHSALRDVFWKNQRLESGILPSASALLGFQRGFTAYTRPDPFLSSTRLTSSPAGKVPPCFGNTWRRSMASLPPAGSLPNSIRYLLYALLLLFCGVVTYYDDPVLKRPPPEEVPEPEPETITNWSNTHEAHPKYYHQPEVIEDLQRVVRLTHLTGRKIRPMGSGLSPNGIAFCDGGMVNLALMDRVLVIDTKKNQVTVQAGARIDQIVEAIRPYGMTLENYASIKEQQAGGFIQVGAHGTGAAIPPVDERVVSMKLATPTQGTLELSAESDPELFYLARCGLGTFGVVAEVTLQCVPSHKLVERTFVSNMKEVKKKHKKWLQENKHLRYMWIPHTDTVVVVQCNPLAEDQKPPSIKNKYDAKSRIKPMQDLYNEFLSKHQSAKPAENASPEKTDAMAGVWSGTAAGSHGATSEEVTTFPALRDKVLAFDPLNPEHVKRVNKAEAEYWKRSEGIRVGWSDEILSFDCGGQQWVSEVCFPTGTIDNPDMSDIKFMEELLQLVKQNKIAAPGPIEQRWTASSRSYMSPASDPNPDRLFSWVGIIMYLPTEDAEQRTSITDSFFEYRGAVQKKLWDAYDAFEHWAKVEIRSKEEAAWTRDRLKKRFPVEKFAKKVLEMDPREIFNNDFIDALLPRHRTFELIQPQPSQSAQVQ